MTPLGPCAVDTGVSTGPRFCAEPLTLFSARPVRPRLGSQKDCEGRVTLTARAQSPSSLSGTFMPPLSALWRQDPCLHPPVGPCCFLLTPSPSASPDTELPSTLPC